MSDPTASPRDGGAADAHAQDRAQDQLHDRGPATPPPPHDTAPDPLRGSRTSGRWLGVVALGVVLILLIVFIAQNTQRVTVSYFGFEGETPLAVALLAAATAGLVLAAIAATLRMWQVRRRVHGGR